MSVTTPPSEGPEPTSTDPWTQYWAGRHGASGDASWAAQRPDAQRADAQPADEQPWDPAYPHPLPQAGPYYAGQQYYPGQYPASPYYPGQQYYAGQPYAPWGATPPPPPAKRRGRRGLVAAGVGLVAAATAVALAFASGTTQTVNGTALGSDTHSSTSNGSSGSGSSGSSGSGSSGSGSSGTNPGALPGSIPGYGGGSGGYPFPGGSSNGSASSSRAQATAKQQVGVVDIVSVLQFGRAAAAGTGVVLSSDGEILTNNHVIDGATSIKVTVVSTGKSYTARVVGTSPTNDIALLKLQSASGLQTANLGDSSSVKVGDSVTGVGNAGGKGGTPSAAAGKVIKLNRTITASDESGSNSETLNGVIVTDAPIQAGDSGGPLYNSNDQVIGIDTAASTSGQSVGFAIPINHALSIIKQIRQGVETTSIHIGYPGFLGVSVGDSSNGGAIIEGVLSGGPADKAGIAGGDVITKVGGTTITNSTQLQKAVSSHQPGSKISVTYLDNAGSHTVTVTLATGPAD